MERVVSTRLVMNVGGYVSSAQQASRATDDLAQRGRKMAEEQSQATGRMQNMASRAARGLVNLTRTGIAIATTATAGLGAAALRTGVAYNTLEQTSRAALTTLLGSAQAAGDQMERLRAFGRTSPFPRQVWIEAQNQLLGFGFAAEDVVPTLGAINDAMSALGGNDQAIREVVRVMAQISSTGRVTAGNLNQLAIRGINAAELLGNAFGKSAGQIRDEVRRGTITAEQFLTTLTEQMTVTYAGAADLVRQTWAGATDRIAGAFRDIGSIIAAPFIDPRGGGAAVEWANSLATAMRSLEAVLGPVVEELSRRATPVFDDITRMLDNANERLQDIDFDSVIGDLSRFAPAISGLGAAGLTASAGMLPFMRAFGPQAQLVAGLVAFGATIPEVRSAAGDLFEALKPLLEILGQLIRDTLPAVIRTVAAVAEAIGPLITVVGAVADSYAFWNDKLEENRDALQEQFNEGNWFERNILAWGNGLIGVMEAQDSYNQRIREGTGDLSAFTRNVEQVDRRFASMVARGDIQSTHHAVSLLASEFGIAHTTAREMLPQLTLTNEAIRNIKPPAEEARDELADLGAQFGITGEDAEEATTRMLQAWSEAAGSFVDINAAFNAAFDALSEKSREAAEKAAVAAGDGAGAWQDYAGSVKVSMAEVIEELEKQVVAQAEWAENLAILTARGVDAALYDHLVRLGPEGAGLVKAFAESTDAEFKRANELWSTTTETGMDTVAQRLAEAGPILQAIAKEHGQTVANNIAIGMAERGTTVLEEARRQGIAIDRELSNYGEVEITPELNQRSLQQVGRSLDDLAKDRTMRITARLVAQATTGGGSQGVNVGQRRAAGGEVRGPGGPTDDAVGPYYLSNREWIIRARSALKYGPHAMRAVNEGRAIIIPDAEGGNFGYRQNILMKDEIDATDFNNLLTNAAARSVEPFSVSGSGKVLPRGRYRIGRGPAAHGYNARDLPAPTGTPIFAAAAGIVSRAARLAYSYGIHAAINHGGWRTLYAHMSQMYVRLGQQVVRGQVIGRVGSTGNSTGPHLHLEPDLARLYDVGGIVPHRGIAVNMSGGPEIMLPPHISRILMNLSSQTPRQTAAPESTPKKEPVVGPSKLEGRLYLDSGELLGVVRGIVTSEVDEFARNRAAGRRYG